MLEDVFRKRSHQSSLTLPNAESTFKPPQHNFYIPAYYLFLLTIYYLYYSCLLFITIYKDTLSLLDHIAVRLVWRTVSPVSVIHLLGLKVVSTALWTSLHTRHRTKRPFGGSNTSFKSKCF